jgi:hypothetical protein
MDSKMSSPPETQVEEIVDKFLYDLTTKKPDVAKELVQALNQLISDITTEAIKAHEIKIADFIMQHPASGDLEQALQERLSELKAQPLSKRSDV